MKKKCMCAVCVIAALLIMLTAVFAICFSNFGKPGVHVLGRRAHIDVQKNCYLLPYDRVDDLQIVGQSTFTAFGYLQDEAGGVMGAFDGHMSVEAYPVPFEYGYRSYTGDIGKSVITFTCLGMQELHPECEYTYTVHILREDPEVIVIHVIGEDGTSVAAVCGENEEQALDNYRRYLEMLKSN